MCWCTRSTRTPRGTRWRGRGGSDADLRQLALAFNDPATTIADFFQLVCRMFMNDGFTDSDAVKVTTQLVRRKIATLRELRLAFPLSVERRERRIREVFCGLEDEATVVLVDVLNAMYSLDIIGFLDRPALLKRPPPDSKVLIGNDVTIEPPAKVLRPDVGSECGIPAQPRHLLASSTVSSHPAASAVSEKKANAAAVAAFKASLPGPARVTTRRLGCRSIHDERAILYNRASKLGISILSRIGSASARFVDLYGPEGTNVPTDASLGAMEALVLGNLSPDTVTDYCRVTSKYLDWLESLRVPVAKIDSLLAAGYLQNLRKNGHSVPTRVRAALVWAENVFRVSLGVSGRDIADFVMKLTAVKEDGSPTDDPAKARMIPPGLVIRLENSGIDSPLVPVRVFAGVAVLCTHGIKRWAEVQCVRSLTLSRDSVVVTSWKSKRKRGALTWAALRTGFSGRDWGLALLDTLKDAGLPGEDFMAFRPSMDLKGFTNLPADWADCCRAVQAALVCGGVDASAAVSFSTHSFKHLYPTMGRQLGLSDPQISTMGSWKSGDPMPGVYDSVACAASLVYKEHIRRNQVAGWRMADVGNTPAAPFVHLLDPFPRISL